MACATWNVYVPSPAGRDAMRGSRLGILCACLLVSGCQPPTYTIFAQFEGGRLVFNGRGDGSWPFRSDEDLAADAFFVRERERVAWAIERIDDPACRPSTSSPPFPLAYGVVPRCFRQSIEPAALREGVLYRADGDGLRTGLGYFTLHPGPEATNHEESEVAGQDWPSLGQQLPPASTADENRQSHEADESAAGGQEAAGSRSPQS